MKAHWRWRKRLPVAVYHDTAHDAYVDLLVGGTLPVINKRYICRLALGLHRSSISKIIDRRREIAAGRLTEAWEKALWQRPTKGPGSVYGIKGWKCSRSKYKFGVSYFVRTAKRRRMACLSEAKP